MGDTGRSDFFPGENLGLFTGEVGVFSISGTVFLWGERGRLNRFCGEVYVDAGPASSISMEPSVASLYELASWTGNLKVT